MCRPMILQAHDFTAVEVFLGQRFWGFTLKFALPPFSTHIPSEVQFSKQNLHRTFDPISTSIHINSSQVASCSGRTRSLLQHFRCAASSNDGSRSRLRHSSSRLEEFQLRPRRNLNGDTAHFKGSGRHCTKLLRFNYHIIISL